MAHKVGGKTLFANKRLVHKRLLGGALLFRNYRSTLA